MSNATVCNWLNGYLCQEETIKMSFIFNKNLDLVLGYDVVLIFSLIF